MYSHSLVTSGHSLLLTMYPAWKKISHMQLMLHLYSVNSNVILIEILMIKIF